MSKMLRQVMPLVLILTGLAAPIPLSSASAEVKLAGVFGDHMVLQRCVALPVWGWADPGEAVTVTLGAQTKTATAAADGQFLACGRVPVRRSGKVAPVVAGASSVRGRGIDRAVTARTITSRE